MKRRREACRPATVAVASTAPARVKPDMARRVRILHLEDVPRDAEVVRGRLDSGGIPCDILVTDTRAGFEAALARDPFDLIICDYNLPGYDGVTALHQAQAVQPNVPVILLSGTVGEDVAIQCLQVGATDYLLKDRLDRLVPAVWRAMQDAESRLTRKRTEVALAQSEGRKAAILESVLDAIITMDAGGVVIEFNAAAERTFGYTKAEAIGRPLADLIIPPALRDAHNVGLARYLTTSVGPLVGKVVEVTAVRSDGSEIPVELAITVTHCEPDPIFTGVLRDITARRQAQTAVRGERDRAQRYLDAPEVILLALDMEGRITLANRYACALLGWPRDELIGRDWIDTCLPARIRDDLRKRLLSFRGGDVSIVENPVLTRSGEERLIEWRNTLQLDEAGQVIGTFSSGSDITERTAAVEALRTAEERTRFALQGANVGIWDMDCTTGNVRWSEILEVQYGLQPGTFRGTYEAFVESVHPDDRESLQETVGKAMKAGTDFSVLNRSACPGGTARWLSGAGRFVLDEDGQPLRGVGISLDVTDRRMLEEQYQQAQKMEAIGQLAGGVAHDFNNLLTVILGNCELALDCAGLDRQCRTDIEEIQKAGSSGAALTRHLLAFSRKEIVEPALLDLTVVVGDMQGMLERLIREDVRIVLRLPAGLARIIGDRGQIEQIVLNLAVNARDAMPDGGTLTIETANAELDEAYARTHFPVTPGSYVILTVADTGCGIAPDVQARMFEPFFTTKAAGTGTGLGLATVHGIVARNGGSVTVQSEIGRGTTFTLYFRPAAGSESGAEPAPPGPRRRGGSETVLVVEDAEALRLLTTRMLQRRGYTVLVADNAAHALRLVEENPSIDVLLTDVVMPGTSGPELTKRLVERWPALKVIYMSGYTDETIIHHGVLNAGIAFLQKPFSSEALERKIREVLDE
jgi:two-component system, cell cycle sensor histidine kinase and response regulator CckA